MRGPNLIKANPIWKSGPFSVWKPPNFVKNRKSNQISATKDAIQSNAPPAAAVVQLSVNIRPT